MADQKPPRGIDVQVSPQEIRVFLPQLAILRAQQHAPPMRRHVLSYGSEEARGMRQVALVISAPMLVVLAAVTSLERWMPGASQEAYVVVFLISAILGLAVGIAAVSWASQEAPQPTASPHRKPYHLRLTQQLAIFADDEVIEMPLEAITAAQPAPGGVQIEANGGVLSFFERMTPEQARWMAALIAERGQQARAALLAAGEDPDKAASSPAALRDLLKH